MINKARRSNLIKLNEYYKDKRFLEQKHFNVLNNSILLFNNEELNYKRFKNSNYPVAGTVIESGFMSRKWEYISNSLFKDSFRKFPYSKINRWSKKGSYKLKPIWKSKLYFRLSETKSFICFAGAGSGKTKGIVEPTIIANALSPTKPNLFITDPKGELSKDTFNFLVEKGYKVKVLNILDEKNTDCFNPFTVLKDLIWQMVQFPKHTSNLTNEIILAKRAAVDKVDIELKSVISSLNEKAGVSESQFWEQSSVKTIHNAAWLLIDDLACNYYEWLKDNKNKNNEIKKQQFHLIFIRLSFQSILSVISSYNLNFGEKYLDFYKTKFGVDINEESNIFFEEHKGLKSFKTLWQSEAHSTIAGVIQNCTNMLDKFNNDLLRNLTIFNTFSLDDLTGEKDQPFALFVTINNSQPETLDYVSWFINYVLSKLNSFAVSNDRTKLKKPLMCIFEEIGNVPYIKTLPTTVNEGRGKNIFVSLFFQTYDQYEKKYLKQNDGGDFARSCEYNLILTNSEKSSYVRELVNYAGQYKYINKKTYETKDINRISLNDIYSIPQFKGYVFHKSINIPYITSFVPYFLIGIESLQQLNIKLDQKLYQNELNIIYNPLSSSKDWTLDEAIAINFNLELMKDVWDLSEEKREKMIKGIEEMKLIEPHRVEYWNECIQKIRTLDNLINNEESNSQDQSNEIKTDKTKTNNKNSKKEDKSHTTKEIENMFKVRSEEVINSSNPKENILIEVLKFQDAGKLSEKEKQKLNNIFLDDKPNISQIDLNDLDLNINKNLGFLMNCDTKEELLNILVPKLKKFSDFEKTINQVNSEYKNIVKRLFEFINIKEEWKKTFNQQITKDELKVLKRVINGLVMIKNIFTKNGQINSISLLLQKKFKRNLNLVTKDYVLFIWSIEQIRCLGSAPINKDTKESIKNIINDDEKLTILGGIADKDVLQKIKRIINEI